MQHAWILAFATFPDFRRSVTTLSASNWSNFINSSNTTEQLLLDSLLQEAKCVANGPTNLLTEAPFPELKNLFWALGLPSQMLRLKISIWYPNCHTLLHSMTVMNVINYYYDHYPSISDIIKIFNYHWHRGQKNYTMNFQ